MEDDELSNEKFEQISLTEKLTQNFNETKMNDLKTNINLIKNTFTPDESTNYLICINSKQN